MLQISQIKLRPDQGGEALEGAIQKILHLRGSDEFSFEIRKKSIDARKKPEIFYVYTLAVKMKNQEREKKILKKNKDKNVSELRLVTYRVPGTADTAAGLFDHSSAGDSGTAESRTAMQKAAGSEPLRPVIIGTGPAGLFCGLALARAGRKPILIERGQDVDARTKTVERFWEGGRLDPGSNVQFGEGGAGTFSDGKLNTGVKDPYGRIRFVLDTFVQAGADPDILYSYKPHVGTDVLKCAVARIRDEIIARGGEVRFSEKLAKLTPERKNDQTLWNLEIEKYSHKKGTCSSVCHLTASDVVLAIGHSSRDTFVMLKEAGFDMAAKAFAVGLRIQHPQGMIDEALYGKGCRYHMPPSPYKLTHRLKDGRGVYSFCMCPGGYVVNASSEEGLLAVNGMSYHDRASGNANSALVVTVSPEEIHGYLHDMRKAPEGFEESAGELQSGGEPDVLEGMEFQRRLERAAYLRGRGRIPVQTFGDYRKSELSAIDAEHDAAFSDPVQLGLTRPVFKGQYAMADVRSILPKQIGDAIEEGILAWDRQICGFADPSALLAGVESRTSSPVRILRGYNLQAVSYPGIYPCGEGAGYAGGITSAAVDGLRVAEAILADTRS